MTTNRPGDAVAIERLVAERAADRIVDQLGALIVKGELKEGAALPSERILAERFGVARGTVREAIHKLADWGLLHTRQGGITRIANVDEAYSIEVLHLRYRLGPVDDKERQELIERRMLQGVAIVALAEVNTDAAILAEVESAIARLESVTDTADVWTLEGDIWVALSRMAKNRILEREVRWWFRIALRPKGVEPPSFMTPEVRLSFYRELLRRLREGDAPARYYLEMTQLLVRSRLSGSK